MGTFAAAASRDITLIHALDVLHQCDYDTGGAAKVIPITVVNEESHPMTETIVTRDGEANHKENATE